MNLYIYKIKKFTLFSHNTKLKKFWINKIIYSIFVKKNINKEIINLRNQ